MRDDPKIPNIIKPQIDGQSYEYYVEEWELLGLDPDASPEEIDQAWENQM